MCRICVEWELGKLTTKEAMNAIGEILSFSEDEEELEHVTNLVDTILDAEMPETTSDSETDENWWKENHKDE